MNPTRQLANAVRKPIGMASKMVTRPTPTASGFRPPAGGLLGPLRGPSLEDVLRDRIVLITGASSGIGAATARHLGRAGGEVVLVARGREKLEETALEVEREGGTAHVQQCDLTDLEAISAMADGLLADLGRIDILINNAGRSIRRSLALSYERMHDFQRTMQLNYFGPVQLMLKLLPVMREQKYGHVINVSSIGVQTRVPRFGAYIASKAALDTLCDAWQAEVHSDNVRFSTVHMPLVRTPMIAATTIYNRFPVHTPDDAAKVLTKAIVERPRRSSPPVGMFAAFADALSPEIMDRVRNTGFELFDDSAAAKGEKPDGPSKDEEVSTQGRVFAELTRGVHW